MQEVDARDFRGVSIRARRECTGVTLRLAASRGPTAVSSAVRRGALQELPRGAPRPPRRQTELLLNARDAASPSALSLRRGAGAARRRRDNFWVVWVDPAIMGRTVILGAK